ncbi:MAG TPA: prolipoprotein diacylglyceryl transferase [Galbitalea sp.]|nr:prolipoprotein diacylglyceryl transferase [Galbitalea sp.]
MTYAPASIPSPPKAWADIYIPIGWLHPVQEWLHSFIHWWPLTNTLDIKTYALCLLAGIIVAVAWTGRRLTQRGAEPGIVLDIAFWAVLFGIVGARTYHVLTHWNDYFGPGQNPLTAFYIWQGGIAIFGSLLGGALGVFIGCRITGVRFWSFADALAPAMLLAQALGRFGNYFNHELYGQPTSLPWGLQIESSNAAYPIGLPAHTLFGPTFLYEMIWNLLGMTVLLLLERHYHFRWGRLIGLYFIFYGVGRVWFESIRIDPSVVFLGLRSNVWGALVAILLGVVIFTVQRRRHPGIEPSVYRPGREWSPETSKVDSDETYSDSDDDDDAVRKPETSRKRVAATSGTSA